MKRKLKKIFDWLVWVKSRFSQIYLKNLHKRVNHKLSGSLRKFDETVNQQAKALLEKNQNLIVDDASKIHLTMTAYLLASYQELINLKMTSSVAISAISDAFAEMGRFWIQSLLRLQLLFSRNSLQYMRRISEHRAAQDYGKSFAFEYEGNGETYFAQKVRCCFYYDFFKANKKIELTIVFCNWDKNWIDSIDPPKHGIYFERPKTLERGDNECVFCFQKISEKEN